MPGSRRSLYLARNDWPIERTYVSYVGDGNNVARSLVLACGKLGLRFNMATPKAYQFDEAFLARVNREAPDVDFQMTSDPLEAVRGATAVYTDVWTSMGQEEESQKRRRDFEGYQVDAELMCHARADAYFMHCLPAHRGEEVTADIIDGPNSIVIEQAANRLHVQKGFSPGCSIANARHDSAWELRLSYHCEPPAQTNRAPTITASK